MTPHEEAARLRELRIELAAAERLAASFALEPVPADPHAAALLAAAQSRLGCRLAMARAQLRQAEGGI